MRLRRWWIYKKMLGLNSMTYFLCSSLSNPSLIQKTLLESKFFFLSTIEHDHLPKNMKHFEFNGKINFSIESVKKVALNDWLFIIAVYSLQNIYKHIHLKWKINTALVFLQETFYSYSRLTVKFFKKLFVVLNRPIKK